VETMQAITQTSFGGPEVLRFGERPRPEPVPTEIRVRVHAAGVNPVDWKTRAGKGAAAAMASFPFTVGWDVAGVVDAVGFGVTRFAPGDAVFGMPWFPRQAGAYAEYVTAPSRHFARQPADIGHVQAGALPLAALTAWQAVVDAAGVVAGQRVLVHAAAGGVGHLAVQIAKERGAYVIATASAAKHDLLADLGVDQAVDYRSVAFERAVRDVDVVIDLMGGEYARRSLGVLRTGGLLLSVPSAVPEGIAAAAAAAGVRFTGMLVEPDHAALHELAQLVDGGRLKVLVSETFALRDAAKAHELGERGRTTGKIVLAVA
jgi:NADPH:quinone reductase-like Zn-dependent oxidoreductase